MSHSILILGSGGRESALAWKLSQDPSVKEIFVSPGNPGINQISNCRTITGDSLKIAQDKNIDLVIIGPEKPLVAGMADDLRASGFSVLGPSKAASMLERSKIESKQFMLDAGIPTAPAVWYDDYQSAMDGLNDWNFQNGIVIKSDALAGGKGVVLCDTLDEAKAVVYSFMKDPTVTVNTERIMFEETLTGVELSAFALCDGTTWRWLGVACDHKRVGDGDTGPNTGGMGTYTPVDIPNEYQRTQIENVFDLTIEGMNKLGTPYQGILFAGLMLSGSGVDSTVSVIEFNIRLGDPETQSLLPVISTPLFKPFLAAAEGRLDTLDVSIEQSGVAVHVVAAAKGYPSIDGTPIPKGDPILIENEMDGTHVFYAGVQTNDSGVLTTAGGRILGVTGVANSLSDAKSLAYAMMERIHFDGMHYRRDIASRDST